MTNNCRHPQEKLDFDAVGVFCNKCGKQVMSEMVSVSEVVEFIKNHKLIFSGVHLNGYQRGKRDKNINNETVEQGIKELIGALKNKFNQDK